MRTRTPVAWAARLGPRHLHEGGRAADDRRRRLQPEPPVHLRVCRAVRAGGDELERVCVCV